MSEEKKPEEKKPSSNEKARGGFDARKKKTKTAEQKKYIWIAGAMGIFLVFAIVTIWTVIIHNMKGNTHKVDESKVKADTTAAAVHDVGNPMQDLLKQRRDEENARAEKERLARQQAERDKEAANKQPPPPSNTGSNAPPTGRQADMVDKDSPLARKLGGGVYVKLDEASNSGGGNTDSFSSSGSGGGNSGGGDSNESSIRNFASSPHSVIDTSSIDDTSGGDLSSSTHSSSRGDLSQLGGTQFTSTKATKRPDGTYLLRHNTYARCALVTKIITDQPGLTECQLTEPLYSANGKTVLADAGARITGEQHVEMRPGQTQIFTSWNEIETSNGVTAQLNSLGAGPMGESGTAGYIDNHVWDRFGGAIALSFAKDAMQSVSNATQKSSSSGYTVNNSEQNVEDMASKALENSINIPPTGYLLPGTIMTVIITRDVDFSTVFTRRPE